MNNYICVLFEELLWRNCSNWIVWGWKIGITIRIGPRSMKLPGSEPFNTLISGKFQRNGISLRQIGMDIYIDKSVDSVA